MNRLAIRLTLAMMGVAILTAVIIVASQQIGFELNLRSLPPEVQESLAERRQQRQEERAQLSRNNQDVVTYFARSRQLQERLLIVGTAIAAIVAAIIALFFARNISKPIERVTAASAKVAKGDLGIRVLEQPSYSSTEAKALTYNFNQMATALETYEAERRDITASIAHDLRTPLTAMQLRLEALKEELLPLTQDEISLLLAETELLERLIADLRILSLADAGRLSLGKEDVAIDQIIKAVIESFKQQASAKQVTIQVKGDATLRAHLDPTRFKQILSNLLENALRVSPEGAKVTVGFSKADDRLLLFVQDEGPGISEKLLPKIFDRYMKDKDTAGSSGLGLAIVKSLVELHGGTVRASNNIDQGATFHLSL